MPDEPKTKPKAKAKGRKRALRVARYHVKHALGPSHQWWHRVVLWTGGLLVGLSAILFARAGIYADRAYHHVLALSPWLALLVLPVGLMVCRLLTEKFFPAAEGSGIPQVIAAMHIDDDAERAKLLSLRTVAGKVVLTLVGLSCGASVGREGPTVQVGASILYMLGRLLPKVHYDMGRILMLSGGAAGVAAAFNTPLAGIIFAIEELSRSFEERTSGTLFTAIIIAGLTSLAILGNYTYFGRTTDVLTLAAGWLPAVTCGVAGGFLGGGFARILVLAGRNQLGIISRMKSRWPVIFAGVCGLLLVGVGFVSGQTTFGTGYQETQSLLQGGHTLPQMFGLLKLLATLVSYISGIPGGIFSPSLAVGAGIGANVATLFPAVPSAAIVVLGMAAYFAGVVQAPITAVVIVTEVVDNQGLTIPLMLTVFVAYGVSRALSRGSLYKSLADDLTPVTILPPAK